MTDNIKLHLHRSESHANKLLHQIWDHQDTMNSLDEAAELIKGSRPRKQYCFWSHDFVGLTEHQSQGIRLLAAIQTCRDHKAGSDPFGTSEQSLFLRANVTQFSKTQLPHTLHLSRKQAQQRALQSKEPSSRDPHAGSDRVRLDGVPGEAILSLFRTLPQTLPSVQTASTLDSPRRNDLNLKFFPIHQHFTFSRAKFVKALASRRTR